MSINNVKIIIWRLFVIILERLLVGKNPPEEIIVIARFKELNDLIFKRLNIIKIENVNTEYNKKILNDCFNISDL